MANKIADKTCIITGASSGIGAAAAERLAHEGARLVLAARCFDAIDALAARICSNGGQALAVATDVTDFSSIRAMVRAAKEHFGSVDILINNAGVDAPCPVVFLEEEKVRRMVDVNLTGVILSTRAALPHMLRQKSGHILNIGSIAGLIGLPGGSVYSATKFALNGFSDALRREVRWYGVHVTQLSLGYVATHLIPALASHAEGALNPPRVIGIMQPAQVADQIAALIRHPRFRVVMPWWYRPLVAGAVGFPGVADFIVRWFLPKAQTNR